MGLGIVSLTLLIANILYFIVAVAIWLVIIFLFLAKASYDTWKDDELK